MNFSCPVYLHFRSSSDSVPIMKDATYNLQMLAKEFQLQPPYVKPLQCPICGKNYKNENYFQLHIQVHINLGAVSCKICERTFLNMNLLKKHMISHSSEQPFECDICHKAYKWKFELKDHKEHHSSGKKYKCYMCNFTTAYKTHSRLQIHL